MNLADLAITISLPPIPPGWFDFGYAVLFDGSLALVRTDRDVFADDDRFIWDGHIRISTFDGRIESEAITLSAGNWPLVDRLPDGRWIVVASRADPTEKNARLSAGDGSPAGAFALGDGVQDIRCAKDGAIWVSYFDEGIFANQNDDGSWPIGSAGIVQCDPEGGVLWRFNVLLGSGSPIVDCYAMTVARDALWCCPSMDFPIIHIVGGSVRQWLNERVHGATAIAVDAEHVVLAGGYVEDAQRVALLHLGDERAEPIGELRIEPPARTRAGLIQGRGSTMHIVQNGCWTRFEVADMRAAL